MFTKFIDLNNDTLIKHAASLIENVKGSEQIQKIYIDVKSSIAYVPDNLLQKASETLVTGRGNNFSKNILLYSLMKINGFDCELRYKYVIDITKAITCTNNSLIPWFYVYVNYLGREIFLDCSFDSSFQRAVGVTVLGDKINHSIEKYFLDGQRAFKVFNKIREENEENLLKGLIRNRTTSIYSRAKVIGYV